MAEAAVARVEGWSFAWLEGRATEARPSWGYQRMLAGRLAAARAACDVQTGGGEVLAEAGAERFPSIMVATEGWWPNAQRAAALLRPAGVAVVRAGESAPLPFPDGVFDLVTSRHPAVVQWPEIARVLQPGGTYFAQHVGGATNREVSEFFLGPIHRADGRDHEIEAAGAEAAGLRVDTCRNERLGLEFFDVGALVYFLRKVIWTVPGFDVHRFEDRLRTLHQQIGRDGVFQSSMSRTLFEVYKPVTE